MYRIGIDVGGTGIQSGLVDEKGNILQKVSIPTRLDLSFEDQIAALAESLRNLISVSGVTEDDIHSIGIGIPGIADQTTGIVIKCTNMNWHFLPLRAELQKWINKPVYIDNDANVAALAESVAGVSAGTDSSVFITIGTGIGSGIIINGKIWSGAHGVGGELGHTIIRLDGDECTCGNHGCLERYCSANAIIRMAREKVASVPDTLIMKKAEGDPAKINAKIIFDSARENDPLAVEVFNYYIACVSQAIANVINFFDPEIIVLGGGVSKAGDFLLDAIHREFPQYVLFNSLPLPKVVLATLGADAGIIGAAMLG